jgi:hypothetical protein
VAGSSQFQGFGEADNTIKVLGARPHIPFLGTAMDIWFDLHILIYIEDADAFRTMKFMTCPGNEMNRGIAQVKRIMAHGLHRIGMEDSLVFFAQLAYGMDIDQVADFIVGMHQGDQGFLLAVGQQRFEVFQVDMAIWFHLHIAEGGFPVLVKVFDGMTGSMVLDRRTDNMPAAQVAHCGRNGGITAFRAARGKKDFRGMGTQDFRHRFTGILDRQPALSSIRINGGRVAEFLG